MGEKKCGKRRSRAQLTRRVELLTAAIARREREAEATATQIGEFEALLKTSKAAGWAGMSPAEAESYFKREQRLAQSIATAQRTKHCLGSTVMLERAYLDRTTAELAAEPDTPPPASLASA